MEQSIRHFIGGQRTAGHGSRRSPVFNPATGATAREVVLGTRADVDAAVQAAQTALPGWAGATPLTRARVTVPLQANSSSTTPRRARRAHHAPSTARCSPTRGARSRAAWRWSSSPAASPTCSRASSARTSARGVDSWSLRQPLGVCAGITPFNFPAMVPLWMFPGRASPAATPSSSSRRRRTRRARCGWPSC